MSAIDVVQAQLDAYNAQDLDRFCACYADDCVLSAHQGEVSQSGLGEIRQRYSGMFAQFPSNRASVLNRMALGNVVIDHEQVLRSPEAEPFGALVIYTVKGDKIARAEFVKEG